MEIFLAAVVGLENLIFRNKLINRNIDAEIASWYVSLELYSASSVVFFTFFLFTQIS